MALHKLGDYYANYEGPFGGSTIKAIKVYASNHEKVGTVRNFLVDGETGRFRYLIMETGLWYVGRRVLIPVGLVQLDYEKQSIYVPQLTKQQIENLPDLAGELGTEASYEEQNELPHRIGGWGF
ncbi:PRC-barrel domain-containing protein [Pseudanabaenaceae cyanobacterium LEGE 13415]|nr:PRC-barrel domain-containing protein [Pseudanabaenaceae cyanobacterium LEGE 13415]